MAQSDGVVSNGSGAAVRADINVQLGALWTNHSGATEPSTKYAYMFWADTTANQLKLRNSSNSDWVVLNGLDGAINVSDGTVSAPGLGFSSDTNTGFYKPGNDQIAVSINGSYRFLVGDNGNIGASGDSLLWNTTVKPAETGQAIDGLMITENGKLEISNFSNSLILNRHSSTGALVGIRYNGNNVGAIQTNGSSTTYNTSSDYRLKENVTLLVDAKTRLNRLSVKRFNFIGWPDSTVDGFIAHDVEAIVPEAISGVKDAVDENGAIDPQGIDQSKLVPLLTAALQEAFAEIAALTARVETLEAG